MDRRRHLQVLQGLLARHRAVAILGARRVGKTTLARQYAARFRGPTAFFDLENPDDLPLGTKIRAVAAHRLLDDIEPLA